MNLLLRTCLLAGAALALVLAGCAGAPGAPPAQPGATPAQPGEPGTDAALTALCDPANETGFNMLATELEGVNEETDTTTLTTLIGTTMANLQSAQVEAGDAVARDAAVTALGQAQTSLDDPATRTEVALQAAGALRTAQTQLC